VIKKPTSPSLRAPGVCVALFCSFGAFNFFTGGCPVDAQNGSDAGEVGPSADDSGGASKVQKPWATSGSRPYTRMFEMPGNVTSEKGFSIESLFDPLVLRAAAPHILLSSFKNIFARADLETDSALDKQLLIEKLVTVDKGRPGDPEVSDACLAGVKAGLLAYPRSFLCFLLKNKCHVFVAPFVTRADTSLEGLSPAGYAAGSTFLNCRAVFTEKGILIGSHFYREGKFLPNLDPYHGVQHETAHAVDHYLARPSLSKEFLTIYKAESDSVSLVDRQPLSYYLNSERGGAIETFGQLLAHKYCHFTEHHTLTLVRCFPRCVQFIDDFFPAVDAKAVEKPAQGPGLPSKTQMEPVKAPSAPVESRESN
jgi:hypothetical protein